MSLPLDARPHSFYPKLEEQLAVTDSANHWQRLGVKKRHGIAVALRSLRTAHSCGIGEYLDLLELIDWCDQIGLSVIQLLPLNDSGEDPSPYSNLSAVALNPLFLSLHALPGVEEKEYRPLQELNQRDRIPFHEVLTAKRRFLADYLREQQSSLMSEPTYHQFVHQNPWLEGYALFLHLAKLQQTPDWRKWPKEWQDPDSFAHLLDTYRQELPPTYLLQYLCHQQLRRVRRYAEEADLLLFGDIPILLSPASADVWQHRSLFDLSNTVGAPPDQYSDDGQNWGFPLYNWPMHQSSNYQWWSDRLKVAESYFHLYRIDHVVGLFRFWAIPPGKTGRDGFFVPLQLPDAIAQGAEHLRMLLRSSKMLPIGEDLGVIPNEVRRTLSTLGMCGTKVIRWQRYWEEDERFIPFDAYPPLSLATVSTHDSEPLKLWWETHPKDAQTFCQLMDWTWEPHLSPFYHRELLQASHQMSSLFTINPLTEYLSLFPDLVHANPRLERINIPGTLSDQNWTYRFIPTIKQLRDHRELNQLMGEMVRPSR